MDSKKQKAMERLHEEIRREKLTQQYARLTVHEAIEEKGIQLQEEWEMDDNTIEITATRWVE